jgi:hypothetical protein
MRRSLRATPLVVALRYGVTGLAAALPLTLGAPAHATLAREASLRHLVTAADLVVDGAAEETKSVWEDLPGMGRRIVTYSRIHVSQTVYGAADGDVWVRTLGGQVGDIGQRVEGEAELSPGSRAILFLRTLGDGTRVVVDMAQGHYHVRESNGAPRLLPAVHPAMLVPRPSIVGARALLAGKPIADALRLIRAERAVAVP